MQMLPYGYANATFYIMMQMFFARRICNLTKKIPFISKSRFLKASNQNILKLDLFIPKVILFYFDEAWMPSVAFLPQTNMFDFDLRLSKIGDHY